MAAGRPEKYARGTVSRTITIAVNVDEAITEYARKMELGRSAAITRLLGKVLDVNYQPVKASHSSAG